ncbi:MAG: glycerol-3-phosphate dehydrogenase/oxidase [Colwellia sp.]|nr:glycerol-3-phosphate dehydrogenase/oxidase [Colwellia sp.]
MKTLNSISLNDISITSNMEKNLLLSRQQRLDIITQQKEWDIIIIGGGITGAGILKQAAQLGLKVLLLEQKDFAWGSSSRSSKMIHGGLRYIAQGQVKLTKESVQERQHLLNDAPQLVNSQSFAMSHYKNQFPSPWIFNSLLNVYDFLAGKKQHRYYTKTDYNYLVPYTDLINQKNNQSTLQKNNQQTNSLGGTQFVDAITDDARLVLRLIQEAQQLGALAINYVKVNKLLHNNSQVSGVIVQDLSTAETKEKPAEDENNEYPSLKLQAKIVINATGAWAKNLLTDVKQLNPQPVQPINIRPLRGSHLIISSWRLPVASAISVLHPVDKRPVQIFPWQNVTVVGTTDVEHDQPLSKEAMISHDEFNYLLAAVDHQFPALNINHKDIISTFAGVRPVVPKKSSSVPRNHNVIANANKNMISPSQEKREHSIWQQPGLLTIAGGKLTTFRLIAQQVLQKLANELNLTSSEIIKAGECIFDKTSSKNNNEDSRRSSNKNNKQLPKHVSSHLLGCYGNLSKVLISQARQADLSTISYSQFLWAELSWAVKYEQVMHLDDLLLRRTRLGNVLPNGGLDIINKIKAVCVNDLNWNEQRWQDEILRYQKIWQTYYSPTIPSVNLELSK